MNQLTVTLIVVIGLLGGFYGGFKYGQNHPPPSTNTTVNTASAGAGGGTGAAGSGTGRGGGGGGGGGGGFGGNAVAGQITAVGNGTITLHETNGTDVQVNVSSARITKASQGTAADLAQNTQVTVVGSTDASGTVNATVISIGGGLGRGGGGSQPSPSPSS